MARARAEPPAARRRPRCRLPSGGDRSRRLPIRLVERVERYYPRMNASALEEARRAAGIACSVQAVDRLAVLDPDDEAAGIAAVQRRQEAVQLSRAHGFTHLALELPRDPADGATVHRD